jgi:RNA polymerase sigma-70 factor (ECF subfamily)
MRADGWSWPVWGGETFPELAGPARFLAGGRICVLPVKLKAGQTYGLWLNRESHADFADTEGRGAVPYLLIFETRK